MYSYKRKHPNCMENFRYYFMEYSDNATIHGLRFLCERKRSILEKLWWFSFLAISLCFCVVLIVEAYSKWERSPVIMTFATSETPIHSITFPTVTICPQIKTDVVKFNLSRLVELYEARNLSREQQKQLHYMSLICFTPQNMYFEDIEGTYFDNNDPAKFFMEVRPDFEFIVQSCYWSSIDCFEKVNILFTPTLTNEGVCFSFNMLDRDEIFTSQMEKDHYVSVPHTSTSEWSLETQYAINATLYNVPRKTRTAGTAGGLDLILKTYSDELDDICGDLVRGYKVIIHSPAQVPNTNKVYFYVGLNQVVLAAVKPNLVRTSNKLKNYSPAKRKCYFLEERRLKFFNAYDQQNCFLECLANFTFKYCNCVGFFMPRDNLTRVCGFNSYDCIEDAKANYFINFATMQENSDKVDCNCIPACTSLDYEIEVSETYWNWAESPKKSSFLYGLNGSEKISRLQVFFKDMQFLSLERNELYGQTDFLASCGGLLGLFIGFSFISLVEIVYFATLKLICNVRKYGRNYWSGADELLEVKIN